MSIVKFPGVFIYSRLKISRSIQRRCSMKIGVLKNFTRFAGKHLCQGLFFNKVASHRPPTLLKKRLWHWCFSVNFTKFLRTPFIQNTFERLLLAVSTLLRLSPKNYEISATFWNTAKFDAKLLISLKVALKLMTEFTVKTLLLCWIS